jgi:hypothetical protein
MDALSSSEMSVLTRATWRNIPEDPILLLVFYIYLYIQYCILYSPSLLDQYFEECHLLGCDNMWLLQDLRFRRSFEMLVFTRATGCHIPEDIILHSYCCEHLKFYGPVLVPVLFHNFCSYEFKSWQYKLCE